MTFLGVLLLKFACLCAGLRHSLIHLLSHSLHSGDTVRFPALAEAWLRWKKSFLLGSSALLGLVWARPFWPFQLKYEVTCAERLQLSNSLPTPREGSSEFLQGALATAFGFSLIPRLATFVLFRDSADIPFHYLLQNCVLKAPQTEWVQLSPIWSLFSLPWACHLCTELHNAHSHLIQLFQNSVVKSSTAGLCFTDAQVITQECWHLHITDLGVKLAGCQGKSSNPFGPSFSPLEICAEQCI